MRKILFLFLSLFSALSLSAEEISYGDADTAYSWFESGLAFTAMHNGDIVNCYYYAGGNTSVKMIDVVLEIVDPDTYDIKNTSQFKYYDALKEVVPDVNLDEYNRRRFLEIMPKGIFNGDNIVFEIDNNVFHIDYKQEKPSIVKHYTSKNKIYQTFVSNGVTHTLETDGIYAVNDNGIASRKVKWSKSKFEVKKNHFYLDQISQKGFLALEGDDNGKSIYFDLQNKSIIKEKDDALAIAILNDVEVLSYSDDSKVNFNISDIDNGALLATHNGSTLENYTINKVVLCDDRFIAIEVSGETKKVFVFEKSSGELKKTIKKIQDPKKPKGNFLAGYSSPNLIFHKKKESLRAILKETIDKNPPALFLNSYSKDKPNTVTEINALLEGRFLDDSAIKSIYINDESISFNVLDGSFLYPVSLEEGLNEIVIKGMDIQNNEQVDTIVLDYEYEELVSRGAKPKRVSLDKKIKSFNYKALLIANQEYTNGVNSLEFPIRDAQDIKEVLVDQYSFNDKDVILLKDATRSDIINTLDSLASSITPQDNLLIFYAGHGIFDENLKKGYWLPVDADPQYKSDWVSNSDIRDYITAFQSQHTLLISDACFSGSIFEYNQRSLATTQQKITDKLLQKKSRKAMTSGLNSTVPDESVFVKYLISELKNNTQEFIRAGDLYGGIRESVMANTENNPQYEVIKNSDHEGGEFIFIKKD